MVTIRSRSSWGARRPDGDITLSGLAQDVFLHHTVTATLPASATVAQEQAQMRAIEVIGYSRFGYLGIGISYNVIVFPSGRAYQGVSWNRRGAHTDGRNSTVRSICFAGNFEEHQPTDAALNTAAAIVAAGRGKWWRPSARVYGHRDIKATACPGKNVYQHKARIAAGAQLDAWKGAMGWPKLRRGDVSSDVKALQRELVARGYDVGPAGTDGDFGTTTQKAVKAFQRDANLTPDAVVGESTQKALKQKDWFDMATQAQLEKIVRNVIRDGYLERVAQYHPYVNDTASEKDISHKEANRRQLILLRRIDATVKAQAAAMDALASSSGVDPADVRKTVAAAVDKALADVSITLTNDGTGA